MDFFAPARYFNVMSLQIAIVGLPNVGKSTLFNALTKSSGAMVGNYPFCTIDPNVGVVEVPDERLQKLATLVTPEKIVPAIVEFVDVAGLVKGASEGEGLGNKFLAHIRECNAIAEVVRVFKDPNVIHVNGSVEPKRDREILEAELILADLQTLDGRMGKLEKEVRGGDKDAKVLLPLAQRLRDELNQGKLANNVEMNPEEKALVKSLQLITSKPVLYVVNLHEDEIKTFDEKNAREQLGLPATATIIPISAKIEQELGQLAEAESQEFLKELGLTQPGLHTLIRAAYDTLGLHHYFTAGPMEVRAWTVRKGALAPEAAGVIHTDFEKGFIRAEVISYDDYVRDGSELSAKEKGHMRLEGKEYAVKDGDVMHFRHAA